MIIFYAHGGSDNHGCEAILKGTAVNLQEDFLLYSGNKKADERYGAAGFCRVISDTYKRYEHPVKWLFCKAAGRFSGKNPAFGLVDGRYRGVYLSVGGDNYCYPGLIGPIINANRRIRANHNRTVLWGTSIEPEALEREEVLEDIRRYDLIFARESLTYQALLDHGIKDGVYLFPDPAFAMKPAETGVVRQAGAGSAKAAELARADGAKGADSGAAKLLPGREIIGINISPLILKYDAEDGRIRRGYLKIIDYILEHTDCGIAMIPHVVKRKNNDLAVIRELVRERPSDRIVVVNDCPADELKAYISQCSFFIGARTHATIAAYSTCVPALVIGYSVKANGIARDLFGTEKGYVVDVRSLENPEQMLESFLALYRKKDEVRKHLEAVMPSWIEGVAEAARVLKRHMKRWEAEQREAEQIEAEQREAKQREVKQEEAEQREKEGDPD